MEPTIGILIFDDVEELDFVGPWEVLTPQLFIPEHNRVVTIAERHQAVRCAKGLRVLPDHTFEDAPRLEVLLVPGGAGTRSEGRGVWVDWIRKVAPQLRWLSSVCTGAFLLQEGHPVVQDKACPVSNRRPRVRIGRGSHGRRGEPEISVLGLGVYSVFRPR